MRIQSVATALLLLFTYHQCESANILVLEELLSPSHYLWFKKVTAGLVAAGHNVTVVCPGPEVSSENLTYIYMEKVYDKVYKPMEESKMDFFEIGNINPFLQFLVLSDWIVNSCKGFVESDGWQTLKNYPSDFKFDLVIHDFPAGICMLSFLQKFNYPPMIFMTAYAEYNFISYITKTTVTPSFYPYVALDELQPTFLSRVENMLLHAIDYICYNYFIFPKLDKIVSSSFENLPPLQELAERSIITMFNYDAAVEGIRQLPPNVIGVGGLQIEKPKPLTGEIKSIADQATNGLILFSLGTNVKSKDLGDARITHFLKAFANFPEYTFLWKFEAEELPMEAPKNVFIRKWIPQNDVLGYNNTKLFITHAGGLSTQEAIWHGIPMLAMPVFLDQFGNSRKSVKKGIAEQLLFADLSSSTLTEKLRLLLTNQKYKNNIAAASRAFRDQKDTPLERGLWWIEWAMRNPDAAHFKSPSKHLGFFGIHSMDVIAFLTIVLIVLTYGVLVLLRKIVRLIFCRGENNSKRKLD